MTRLLGGSTINIVSYVDRLTFNRLYSILLSNTNYEEDQPCHLQLKYPALAISLKAQYDAPRAAPRPGRGL